MAEQLTIAVLGGTGDLGGGLAWQLVQAGYPVIIGSRAQEIGMQAWHAGPIDNAAVAESLTSVLIFMNKRYKFPGAGIKISGGRAA